MKRIITLLCCLFTVLPALWARGLAGDSERVRDQAETSYAMGMLIGEDLKQMGMPVNYGAFLRGFRDVMENNETSLSRDEAMRMIQEAYEAAMLSRAEENLEKQRAFLEENGRREGVSTTGTGLQYEVISTGPGGERPGPADTVRVNYEGSLLDGTVFDSSYDWGEPAEFPLQGVIPGMAEGIQLMTVGSACRLYIPSGLAYGDEGGGVIPPGSLLIFDVELLEILPPETPFPGEPEEEGGS
jgi:FKBP-type peptidyl-prolyl cis-trans isomerase FkpA